MNERNEKDFKNESQKCLKLEPTNQIRKRKALYQRLCSPYPLKIKHQDGISHGRSVSIEILMRENGE